MEVYVLIITSYYSDSAVERIEGVFYLKEDAERRQHYFDGIENIKY